MSDTPRKHQTGGSNVPENKLAIVVARANELRNVLKLDKQSPFVTLRLQDQEESTKVLPRAGQTPRWDEAHWFSLEGIDVTQEKNKNIIINVYHQKKGDAKLICCGEVDYTPALTQGIDTGYDGWFPLFWEGRPAGKIYLEFTYYPKVGEVPIGTKSLGRSGAGGRSMMNNSVIQSSELPVLGVDNRGNNNDNGFKTDDDDFYSDIEELQGIAKSFKSPFGSPKKSMKGKAKSKTEEHQDGGIFQYLDRKLQNLAGKFASTETGSENGDSSGWLSIGEDYNDVKRKVESPELIKKAPGNLFGDSLGLDDDEDDDDDEENAQGYDQRHLSKDLNKFNFDARRSITKRQERILGEALVKSSDEEEEEDNEDLVMGQAVDFKTSTRSKDLRESYAKKPLPMNHNYEENSEDEMTIPPPPPKHIIPTNSLFESGMKSNNVSRDSDNANNTNNNSGLSWYERRMKSRRGLN